MKLFPRNNDVSRIKVVSLLAWGAGAMFFFDMLSFTVDTFLPCQPAEQEQLPFFPRHTQFEPI